MAKQAKTLTRDAIQYETKRDFSTSQHGKQNKRFLATATALNTTQTSKYTYELLLTSADRLLQYEIQCNFSTSQQMYKNNHKVFKNNHICFAKLHHIIEFVIQKKKKRPE